MLASNWRTWRESQGSMSEDGAEAEMDIDKTLDEILKETGTAENRGAKMAVDEFLALLNAFHKRGIHFGG